MHASATSMGTDVAAPMRLGSYSQTMNRVHNHPISSTALNVELNTRPAFGRVERKSGGLSSWKQKFSAGRPDPWLHRKFGVIILFALVIWSFYVVVGRVCTPMIQRRSPTGLGRATGVGTLVGYVFFWLMSMWTYIKMIVTGPGHARDRIPKSPPPAPNGPNSIPAFQPSTPAFMGGESNPSASQGGKNPSYFHQGTPGAAIAREPTTISRNDMDSDPSGPDPSEFAPITNMVHDGLQRANSRRLSSSATLSPDRLEATGISGKSKVADWRQIQRPVPRVETGPRWCRFCEINKPDRTHHCRHCGTCVMQFDHHCLWIGQCVGWANHKFFIIFNIWGLLFCFYMMILLIIYATKDSSVDGQIVGLIAVSALFGLFTAMMLVTHIHLIVTGRSTVESFQGRDQQEREAAVLQKEYGYLWHNQERRKVYRRWKEEWGGTDVDGRWKWGSAGEMWQQEMGSSWVEWILPIGTPLGNGLAFPQNPRFGPHGEWLQRKDWPSELR